ncbi:SymE family type I addiction module toxin [Winslowiella iniecta]|nr:SymE family type I addiction module toxin [Winslowiella iniecta]
MSGKWLREAGFETGQAVAVKVEAGGLILTTSD